MTFRRIIASLIIVCLTGLGQIAQAAPISTDAALAAGKRESVLQFLDRADVQQQLQMRGVSPADAKARIASLSDAEVAQLAGQIDSLPAGGDVGILGFVLVVFLVLLLTDILGFTHIFPFTKPIK